MFTLSKQIHLTTLTKNCHGQYKGGIHEAIDDRIYWNYVPSVWWGNGLPAEGWVRCIFPVCCLWNPFQRMSAIQGWGATSSAEVPHQAWWPSPGPYLWWTLLEAPSSREPGWGYSNRWASSLVSPRVRPRLPSTVYSPLFPIQAFFLPKLIFSQSHSLLPQNWNFIIFWPIEQYFNWHQMALLLLKIPCFISKSTSLNLCIISTSGCGTWPNELGRWPASSLLTEGSLFCFEFAHQTFQRG